jgi:16S rRNA (guanine1516-N2)-methyltransferase
MSRFHLITSEHGLVLTDRLADQHPLQIDFSSGKLSHRRLRGGKKELLLKAVGAKPGLRVSDWTAGLGTDSLLMASAGCLVNLYERSPILWILLNQALQQGALNSELESVVARMTLFKGDVLDGTRTSDDEVDVVYLDPMFPSRKKTALVNGPMQYLQNFLGEDDDADKLVQAALNSGAKRVVVKRPVTAPEDLVAFSLPAKANRFDVYLP